jgi:plastocyanin
MRKLSILAVVAGALALAGCGSSSNNSTGSTTASTQSTTTPTTTTSSTAPSSTAPSGALALEANREGQLKYNKTALTANAGQVSIDFANMSPIAHNVTIESASHQVVGATPTFQGGTKLLTLKLKPGTYKFFCSVPGHRMAGMEGTLTVK